MNWLQRLSANPYVEIVLVTDNQGKIRRSSRLMSSEDELIASMIQAAEVLAQSLITEFERGPVQMLQISTANEHMLVFPLALSGGHLVTIVSHNAPLPSIITQLEQMLPDIDLTEYNAINQSASPAANQPDEDEWNAEELIEAVREWLQSRPSDNH